MNPFDDWTIEQPIDFEVGETYIVKAYHVNGYWASFLITITEITPDGDYGMKLETILDGSPGILEGYLNVNDPDAWPPRSFTF